MQFVGGSSSLTSTKSRGASNEAKKYRAQQKRQTDAEYDYQVRAEAGGVYGA
jgi:hypothetical protein